MGTQQGLGRRWQGGVLPPQRLTLNIQTHCVLREHFGSVQDPACHVFPMVAPLWLEGELALCVDLLNSDGGDGAGFGLFQGPLQVNGVPEAGKIQLAGQSDVLGCLDI